MKYLKQFTIIAIISFAGEFLHSILPLPIPASIYGLVIMLIALLSGIVKIEQVKDAAVFLIEIMPVMFIPAAAALLSSWGVLAPVLIPVSIITLVSTILVMAAAGRATQRVIRIKKRGEKSNNE